MKSTHKPHAKDICECGHSRIDHNFKNTFHCFKDDCNCNKFKLKLAFMDGTK